jgi:hypothetical protein
MVYRVVMHRMMHYMTAVMFNGVMDRVVNLGKGCGGHQ